MPDIVFDSLHLEQGFNFRQDVQDAAGWLTSLTIGTQQLAADLALKSPNGALQAVAVMRYFKWSGGVTDPIELKANISTPNRNMVWSMLHAALPSTSVQFSFQITYFDQQSATFYTAMLGPSQGTSLNARIAKEGKQKLELSLPSSLASETVKSPQNYEMELTVMPAAQQQSLTWRYAPGSALIKQWGIAVA